MDLFEQDVWDMCWSAECPDHIAIMEKSRLYILRGNKPEEPLTSSAYICEFRDLEVKSVHLDDIMQSPEAPLLDSFITFEARSLRDARSLMSSNILCNAYQFVEDNPHPRIWRLLAESALQKLDFDLADKAFVRYQHDIVQ